MKKELAEALGKIITEHLLGPEPKYSVVMNDDAKSAVADYHAAGKELAGKVQAYMDLAEAEAASLEESLFKRIRAAYPSEPWTAETDLRFDHKHGFIGVFGPKGD